MEYLYRMNKFLEKWMPAVTPACLLAGVLLAGAIGKFIFIVPWIFAFMTFAGSLGSNFRDVGHVFRHPLPLVVIMFLLHVWMPLIAYALANLFFASDPYFVTGIVLEFVVPVGIVSFLWVSIYGGNGAFTLSLILIDTLVAPFLVPLSLHVLIGSDVKMDPWGMMREMLLMVALPAFLGIVLNQVTKGGVKTSLAPKLAPFSKLALICVVTLNSTKVAPFFHRMTPALIGVALLVLAIASTGYLWGWLAARLLRRSKEELVCFVFNSGMRNISVGAVIAGAYFPGEVMFPVMIGTLFQQLLAGLYAALLNRSRLLKKAA